MLTTDIDMDNLSIHTNRLNYIIGQYFSLKYADYRIDCISDYKRELKDLKINIGIEIDTVVRHLEKIGR